MKKDINTEPVQDSRLINEIIEIEWTMFDKVNNQGGRAACQDDKRTFYVMRFSQFSAFGDDMLRSYRRDLEEALDEGRNLIMEKYAYMMEFTDPAYFDRMLKKAFRQFHLQRMIL